jgi:hypothetical protein
VPGDPEDPRFESSARTSWPPAPHLLLLVAAWVIVTAVLTAALAQGTRQTGAFELWSTVVQAGYVAVFLWFLHRTGRTVTELPEAGPAWVRRSRFGQFLSAATLALLLTMVLLSDDGFDILLLSLMAASIWIVIAWRREVRLRRVVTGVALSVVAILSALPFRGKDLISDTGIVLLAAFVLPMFVAGGLLIDRSGFSASQLHAGRFRASAMSFLKGCALFVPLGLINAADDGPGEGFPWVTEGWMPLSLPLFSGIAEEAWFRLLLVSLCYFVLRPVFKEAPEAAVLCAVLFSAIIFGLGHGRSLDRLLTTGLLYGVPLAAVFAKRDWEHAVGAHYMINMIPWLMAYLEN